MSSSSKKHTDFVQSAIGQKLVTELPGIGSVTGKKLNDDGITRVYQVFGQFLVLNKDREKFYKWLGGYGANEGQCKACFDALDDWSKNHLD